MKRRKDKPGVLIYFDIRGPIEELSYEQRGELFTAILDYAAEGIIPEFEDSIMRMAWAMVRPSVDRDDDNYRSIVTKRTYASYCRVEKEAGREPLPFAEWEKTVPDDTNSNQMISNDVKWYHVHPTQPNPTQLNPTQPNTTQPNSTQLQHNTTQPNTWLSEFEGLWSSYPRKDGKKDAFRHYQRARKNGTTFEEVKAGILNYCEYIRREKIEQRYIMKGSTWFNGEHWSDEYVSTRQPTTMDLVGKMDLSDWGVQ